MEWVLRSPQMHSTFSNLGFAHADGYHVNENCIGALETILKNLVTEDKYYRSFRRSISFGQNIKKDLIPLLIHAKEDKIIELLIKILVNLTTPVECLLSLDIISQTDFGRHMIFEINNLLVATKSEFTDHRPTNIVVEYLKKNLESKKEESLPPEICSNINTGLLLLRNILHIPEDCKTCGDNSNGPQHTVQNQILWNIFSQSIDKILLKLMVIPDAAFWGVTMVQLIALLYKDQHVVTLHKLLNLWLETSLSESSEDNESNTSPPDRAGSEDSSPILTSDPTSDSSDTGGSGKSDDSPNSVKDDWNSPASNDTDMASQTQSEKTSSKPTQDAEKPEIKKEKQENVENMITDATETTEVAPETKSEKPPPENQPNQQSEDYQKNIQQNSDCGYGTQIENQESISTSSNEDDLPSKKPVHQKPHNPKQRVNTKIRSAAITLQERKRKKIVKRAKSNIISNVQGLNHKTPTDDDISNILKEFTVDFLLKGYNPLVRTLHNQILINLKLEIDTSHFFWLVTYFLKFAVQIELDLEHVSSVLSYEILSYLTAEGVNLCEQFELAIKLDGNDLKPSIRRLHLVVTAIREFVKVIEVYKKISHFKHDQDMLNNLQIKMCETEELRSLFVLLLRHYNPKYHSKQYLQDIIITNHILLSFMDSVMKLPNSSGSTNMIDHLKQFATPVVMHQYGLLLDDYQGNGEFVNDCIFTLMHHVGGELGSLISLFQPKILKIFTSIWQSEFEICDDWSDLIEYVINTFIKKPYTLQSKKNFRLQSESFEEQKPHRNSRAGRSEATDRKKSDDISLSNSSKDRWTETELSALNWNFMQSKTLPDVIGEIVRLFREDGIYKTRDDIIKELLKQNWISKEMFDELIRLNVEKHPKTVIKEIRDDEIGKLCDQLTQDGKSAFLYWVQKVLLDTCYVKMYLDNKAESAMETSPSEGVQMLNFECFKKKEHELPVMSAVSYHSLLFSKSVPLVPWNCEQAAVCKDLKFLQLLHKIGLHMPVDTGRLFIRIPHCWAAETLYEVAGKLAPIPTSQLKFKPSVLTSGSGARGGGAPAPFPDDGSVAASDTIYQIHKQKQIAVNYTPKPSPTYDPENDEADSWIDIIQKSQDDYKLQSNCTDKNNESAFETASVASDLTRMYVSDEEEKEASASSAKRRRVHFTLPL